jgi:hypothetical protein
MFERKPSGDSKLTTARQSTKALQTEPYRQNPNIDLLSRAWNNVKKGHFESDKEAKAGRAFD